MKLICPHCGASHEARLVSNITPEEQNAIDFLKTVEPVKRLGRPRNKPALKQAPKLPETMTTRDGVILKIIGENAWQYKTVSPLGNIAWKKKPISKMPANIRAKARAYQRSFYEKRKQKKAMVKEQPVLKSVELDMNPIPFRQR